MNFFTRLHCFLSYRFCTLITSLPGKLWRRVLYAVSSPESKTPVARTDKNLECKMELN